MDEKNNIFYKAAYQFVKAMLLIEIPKDDAVISEISESITKAIVIITALKKSQVLK